MAISTKDIVFLTLTRSKLTELCEEVWREHVHLTLLEDAVRGVEEVNSGKLLSAAKLRARYGR